jgi:hypothetical protein
LSGSGGARLDRISVAGYRELRGLVSHDDQVATKLVAHADRWADDAVMSRGLIDRAMLCPDGSQPGAAKRP